MAVGLIIITALWKDEKELVNLPRSTNLHLCYVPIPCLSGNYPTGPGVHSFRLGFFMVWVIAILVMYKLVG